MKKIFIFSIYCSSTFSTIAQLYVSPNAIIYLQNHASVVLQGDLKAFSNIEGSGTVVLKGSGTQPISVNNNKIGNLILDNEAGALVSGSLQVSDCLELKKGIFNLNGGVLTFSEKAVVFATAGSFINTSSSGFIRKILPRKPVTFLAPLGCRNGYMPVLLSTAEGISGSYVNIGIVAGYHPHLQSSNALPFFWKIEKHNISGPLTISALFDKAWLTTNPTQWAGARWNGSGWQDTGIETDLKNSTIKMQMNTEQEDIAITRQQYTQPAPEIFPNPFHNSTTLKFYAFQSSTCTLQFIDAHGSIVRSQTFNVFAGDNAYVINTGQLSMGYYSVRLVLKDKRYIFNCIRI